MTTLAISLFFHFCATLLWVGGLVVTSLMVYPEVRNSLEKHPDLNHFLTGLRRRLNQWSNFALAVLIVTGLIQMSLDDFYGGLLQFENTWSQVLLLKHGVIVAMVITGLALQYGIVPSLERTSLLLSKGKGDPKEWDKLRRREMRLAWFNTALGISVLALSAWAGSL